MEAVFWNELEDKVERLKDLEGEICANLMKDATLFETDVPVALKDLVFHVTTQFPVSDAEGYSEDDASDVIQAAHAVSERFMAFFRVCNFSSVRFF